MKKIYISTLVTLLTLTVTQASANDLMNYGELSLSYSDHKGTYTSNFTNLDGTIEEDAVMVDGSDDFVALNLSVDFGGHFFGGIAYSERTFESEATFSSAIDVPFSVSSPISMSGSSKATSLFIGGAYHIDQNTHLFAVATHSEYSADDITDSEMYYHIGVKKAWGNFVGTIEKNVNVVEGILPLSITGKYYFSNNVFAGARLGISESDTRTTFTVGYTF